MKKKVKSFLLLSALSATFLAVTSCSALSLVDTSGNYKTGNYTLDDIRGYAVYLMRLILSLVGTLSLIAFVYGGMTFLLSAGSPEQVKKGMGIIKAAVVGLIITFASVLIINIFFRTLGITTWNPLSGSL
jgi:Type IV secretion system pilin